MDVESAEHLERLRDQPAIKAAILRLHIGDAREISFERATKNVEYKTAVDALAARVIATGDLSGVAESTIVYGNPCWLLAIPLASSPNTPYVVAIAGADRVPIDELVLLLENVCRDYWYGSTFFK